MSTTLPDLVVTRPTHDLRPILVSIPHAGCRVPEDEIALYAQSPEELTADGDLFVDRLYEGASELGVTVVQTTISRFVIDLNRFEDDLHPSAVEGAAAIHREGYLGKRGLIWAVNTRGEPVYHAPLTRAALARRLGRYYHPYHAALRDELRALRERFGFALLLDAHSMPSRATALHPDALALRPDVVPGDLDGQSCAPWVAETTRRYWEERGLSVVPNHPYRGGAITRLHHAPGEGVHAVQLELNRALYMDEVSRSPHAGLARLREQCLGWVAALAREVDARATLAAPVAAEPEGG